MNDGTRPGVLNIDSRPHHVQDTFKFSESVLTMNDTVIAENVSIEFKSGGIINIHVHRPNDDPGRDLDLRIVTIMDGSTMTLAGRNHSSGQVFRIKIGLKIGLRGIWLTCTGQCGSSAISFSDKVGLSPILNLLAKIIQNIE